MIQVGNNGPLWYRDLVKLRQALRGIPDIVVVNVRNATSWQDESNNALVSWLRGWPAARTSPTGTTTRRNKMLLRRHAPVAVRVQHLRTPDRGHAALDLGAGGRELLLRRAGEIQRERGADRVADEHGGDRLAEAGLLGHVPHDPQNETGVRELDHPEAGVQRQAAALGPERSGAVGLHGGRKLVARALGDPEPCTKSTTRAAIPTSIQRVLHTQGKVVSLVM